MLDTQNPAIVPDVPVCPGTNDPVTGTFTPKPEALNGHSQELRELQAKREEELKARALIRFRDAMLKKEETGHGSQTAVGQQAIRGHLQPLSEAIEWAQKEGRTVAAYGTEIDPRGRGPGYIDLLRQLPANITALLALKAAIDEALKPRGTLPAAARELAEAMEREAMVREFARVEGTFIRECAEGFKKRGVGDQRAAEQLLIQMREKAGTEWQAWNRRDRQTMALDLIHSAVRACELFELSTEAVGIGTVSRGKVRVKTAVILRLTEVGREWWEKRGKQLELFVCDPQPMICTPIQWQGAWGGGYVSPETPPYPLVKTRNRDYLRSLYKDQLADVLSALNTIQETPWKVHLRVLSVASRVWTEQNGGKAGLCLRSIETAMPPRAPEGSSPEEIKLRNREARMVHLERTRHAGQSWRITKALSIATECSSKDIWFPYQLDFRGRIYPMVPVLSPQGTDLEKGMLQFAEGKPLGSEDAACWLAIHGANSFGKDKLPLQERVDWVQSEEKRIRQTGASVEDAVVNVDWWGAADKPFAFLAWCFEWADYLAHCEAGKAPEEFVSYTPVSLDGTCNGLQHLSAMTRDEIGGAFVNLTDHEHPADIYARVAERVTERLQEVRIDADEGEQRKTQAAGWLRFGIDRKITKRVVMVVPYGGTQKACRDYVRDSVSDLMNKGRPAVFKRGRELLDASTMLAGAVWDGLSEVLVGARRTMKWLQKAARLLAAEGKAMTWTAPSGFPVLMDYRDTKRVQLQYGPRNENFRSIIREDTLAVSSFDQGNGISPNYTHSLDAAHLVLTVNTAAASGVTAWAVVHDSYGTHAADVPVLTEALRAAFHHIYEADPLATLEEEVRGQLTKPDKLPARPTYGNWEPKQVLEAAFFFH